MLDKEFHIRFTLSDVGKALCFSPILVVMVYLIACLPWTSEQAPSWVQAVGSVVAILAAGAFPLLHDAHREARERQRVRKLLVMQGKFSVLYLGVLYRAVNWSLHDFGEASINGYLIKGHHHRLRAHVEGLALVPVTALTPWEFRSLRNLKAGCAYAVQFTERFGSVDFSSESYRADIRLLKHHLDMAKIIHRQLASGRNFAD